MFPELYRRIFFRISRSPLQSVRKVRAIYCARKIIGSSTLGVAFAKCAEDDQLNETKREGLTREQCIKQACVLSVNSATTLLTTTTSALIDICHEYKKSLTGILSLLEELKTVEGDNPQLWDAVVEARAHVNRSKAALTELTCYMESVEKVVNSTTEAAFLAGGDYICTALCERLYSAKKEIQNQIDDLKVLEEDYMKLQKDIVSSKDENKEKPRIKKPQLFSKTEIPVL